MPSHGADRPAIWHPGRVGLIRRRPSHDIPPDDGRTLMPMKRRGGARRHGAARRFARLRKSKRPIMERDISRHIALDVTDGRFRRHDDKKIQQHMGDYFDLHFSRLLITEDRDAAELYILRRRGV